MKCPCCDGCGTSNTCINGTFQPCTYCNGTGEVDEIVQKFKNPYTNFQRITASPEALAEFMDKLSYACIDCGEKGPEYINENCPFGDFGNCADRGSMFLWLKEESKE